MFSRDSTKTSINLIKQKIIKTDTVLNIVCEKNAVISNLQSKLDLVSSKFIEKCAETNSLQEQFDSKNKECYTLSSKLIKLQEQHDQLIFEAAYAQTEYNKLSNDRYLTVQNLESELIKLNARVNSLQSDNEFLKLGSSILGEIKQESQLKATVKDFKEIIKKLEDELKNSKNVHNTCLKDLIATKDECRRLELVFNNYKNNNKQDTTAKCARCTNKEDNIILYKSSTEVQREKYQKLLSQYEELLLTVDKLKNDNIKVAEKYSSFVFQSPLAKELVDTSSQTVENEIEPESSNAPEKTKGIDNNVKSVEIRHLKSERLTLKQEITKIVSEKRVLQADIKRLSQEITSFQNKYDEAKLERDALLLESQIKSIGVSIETQTTGSFDEIFQDNTTEDDVLVNDNEVCDTVDHLGLNLSSSESESEKEFESYDNILEEMLKFRRLLSPFPKSPTRYIPTDIQEFTAEEYSENDLDTKDISRKTSDAQNICTKLKLTNSEATQTDFVEINENLTKSNTTDIGCQSFDILTEERGTQCSHGQKIVNIGCQVDILKDEDFMDKKVEKLPSETNKNIKENIFLHNRRPNKREKYNKTWKKALRIIKQANYDIIKKRNKQTTNKKSIYVPKENLNLALEVFKKYSITMSFKNGDLMKVDNKNDLLIKAFNSFMFGKSNRMLRKFCRNFRDLNNAMNVANRRKLSAVIINGIVCDNKMLENCQRVDNEINELFKNRKLVDVQKLRPILDEDENLIGFGDENVIKHTKLTENKKETINTKSNQRFLNKKGITINRKLCKKSRIKKTQRMHDLRSKFELKIKETEESRKLHFLEAVSLQKSPSSLKNKPDKNNFISLPTSNKDSKDSEDIDSGYTDGSETSEITKDIESANTRILRSSFNRKRSNSSSSQKTTLNKKRKITSKELFGSDDSDSSESVHFEEKVCVKKQSPSKIKKSASVFDKMKKIIRTYNPRARTDTSLNKNNVLNDNTQNSQVNERLELTNDTLEFERVEEKCETIERISQKAKTKREDYCQDTLRSKNLINDVKKTSSIIRESSQINLESKEHLMQRFISDIPIIKPIPVKPVEKKTFKKPLARPKISIEIKESVIKLENTGDINRESDELIPQSRISIKYEENNGEDGEITSDEESETENEEKEANQNEISDDEGLKLLNKLIRNNCEESIVSTVHEKISHASSQQISRIIIYLFYKYRSESAEPSHTPLAPSLSQTYKTLIGFVNILSRAKHENLFSELLDQLEAKFLLHTNAKVNSTECTRSTNVTVFSLEQVFKVYVSMCMLRTEVLRLRRFLCDLAYFQRDGFYGLMYAVFTIWPAVLPKQLDENEQPLLKENDALLMEVLMLFVFKKRNSEVYMHYRPFLTTFAFGFYKYNANSIHMKLIFDHLVEKFTTSDSDILAYALIILFQRITNVELLNLLRSESFNNVFKASDKDKLIAKSKLLWLLDRIIPEIKSRGDRNAIQNLQGILQNLETKVDNDKVKNFICSCLEKLNN